MLTIKHTDPTKVYIQGGDLSAIKEFLTYEDTSVNFQIKKFKNNKWLSYKLEPEVWKERLDELVALKTKCLLQEDDLGYYTHAGLASSLQKRFNLTLDNQVQYPYPGCIPWAVVPPPLRPYQIEAKTKLLEAKHGAVSIGTGLGKTLCLTYICKELGLKAIIMAPFSNIAHQIYDDFCKYLGTKYVGLYGDGKHETKKLFTICVAQSLARLDENDVEFQELSKAQVLISDESHTVPANTFAKVCLELGKTIPYRFFFSGTQTRGDGGEMLLEGIIGDIVFNMDVREGVEQGYLSRPIFKMYQVPSQDPKVTDDINAMTRRHLYYNPEVNRIAGEITNVAVSKLNHSVLILIDEFEQFNTLLPYIRHEVGFAHGGITKDNKGKIPESYHKSDTKKLVQAFNERKLPVLIGTSCISTGTDIKAVKTLIYLKGGRSEIELRQGMGRGTRLFQLGDYKKSSFLFIDFDVTNIEALHRHAMVRAKMCKDVGPVRVIPYACED
jgi:superfamily II DNA or RNA helicase